MNPLLEPARAGSRSENETTSQWLIGPDEYLPPLDFRRRRSALATGACWYPIVAQRPFSRGHSISATTALVQLTPGNPWVFALHPSLPPTLAPSHFSPSYSARYPSAMCFGLTRVRVSPARRYTPDFQGAELSCADAVPGAHDPPGGLSVRSLTPPRSEFRGSRKFSQLRAP